MRSIYDYDPSPRDDPMVSIINRFIEASVMALMPEKAVLLKAFPFCEWVREEASHCLTSFRKCSIYPNGFPERRSNVKREKPATGVPRVSRHHTSMSSGAW